MQYSVGLQIPPAAAAFALFETTGWNDRYRLDESQYARALAGSWRVASAWAGPELIGLGRLNSDGVQYATLHDLITAPGARRLGVASAILEVLKDECRRHGIRQLQLFSAAGQMAFYQARGFAPRTDDAAGMQLPFPPEGAG